MSPAMGCRPYTRWRTFFHSLVPAESAGASRWTPSEDVLGAAGDPRSISIARHRQPHEPVRPPPAASIAFAISS